jgi:uncharacterized HAD superfamily protein
MIVGFDIDGTITRHPPFFAFLADSLRQAGHRVLIITFREDRPATEADLKNWGIVYNKLITSTLDSCLEHGVDEWKAFVCRQEKVDIFFEDDPDVLKQVDPATLCFMPVDTQLSQEPTLEHPGN